MMSDVLISHFQLKDLCISALMSVQTSVLYDFINKTMKASFVGARPKTRIVKSEDWKKCQNWMLGLATAKSAKVPSLDNLRDEYDLYIYLKVA